MFEDWRGGKGLPRQGTPLRGLRRGVILLLVAGLLGGGAIAAGITYYNWCQGGSDPPYKPPANKPVSLVVPRGARGSDIVNLLHTKGVIRCSLIDRIVVKRNHRADSIRAGTYHLFTNMALSDALDVLNKRPPKALTVRLLIPPGFRVTQIAARVQSLFGISAHRFLSLAESGKYSLPPFLPKGTKTLEGFLFPQTYSIVKKTATADSIIKTLLQEFGREVGTLPWANVKKLGVSDYQVVLIASMIEKETGIAADRPKIAEVIYRRLKMGIHLGIDASLVYVFGPHLTQSELKSDNPYNTRTHKGLPPTPIASPQLASIKAALQPSKVPYLYYVACSKDGPGRQRFSTTYSKFLSDERACQGG